MGSRYLQFKLDGLNCLDARHPLQYGGIKKNVLQIDKSRKIRSGCDVVMIMASNRSRLNAEAKQRCQEIYVENEIFI